MSSPEIDAIKRFGVVGEDIAKTLAGATGHSSIRVKVFSRPEDIKWCAGAREAQGKANHRHFGTARPVPDASELIDRVDQARKSGEVPFMLEGPIEEMPGFLNRAGITDVEFIPPIN